MMSRPVVKIVKVTPKAKRNSLVEKDDRFVAHVTAAPEKGKANEAVVELLAERFDVPKSAIALVSGETSRVKKFRIYLD